MMIPPPVDRSDKTVKIVRSRCVCSRWWALLLEVLPAARPALWAGPQQVVG